MVTKCFFDDEAFVKDNARTMIVSNDTHETKGVNVRIEIIRAGELENVVSVNGQELILAIMNCTNRNPWHEF